jgi:PAS domain S-box-containing protein
LKAKPTSKGSSGGGASSSSESKKKKGSGLAVDFSVFDSLLDAMVAIDEDGSVLAFNAAAEKAFGYARRKVIGQNVKMLMPDSYAKKHDHYLARYATTGVKNVVDKRRVVMAKAANGSMFPIELAVTEKSSDGVTYFVGMIKLMTDEGGTVVATRTGGSSSSSDGGATSGAANNDVFAAVRKTLNAMQEAAVVISETGRIEVFNEAASKLFGHASAAAIGQRVEMLMPSPHKVC